VERRPAPQALLGGFRRAVEILSAGQMVIEPAQQAVHQVARPMAAGVSICLDERRPLVAQRQHLLPDDPLVDVDRGALAQATHPLRERAGLRGMVRTPDPLPQVGERLLQVPGPLPDLQERMEEAEDDRRPFEERPLINRSFGTSCLPRRRQ